MTSPEGLIHRSLADFARAVAAGGPVPGSGSVSAAAGALGVGLAIMALRPGRNEGERGSRSEFEGLLAGLLADVDEDARAFTEYLDSRAGRRAAAPAVERAIAVPREIAERALAALEALHGRRDAVPERRRSEGFTAAHLLLAAAEGALFTARANLPALEPAVREARRRELESLRARAAELRGVLEQEFRDEPS